MNLPRAILRAAKASPREWQVRARQMVFSRMNELCAARGRGAFARDGHLRSLGVAAEELSSWARQRPPRWFVDDVRQRRVQQYFHAHPPAAAELIERADRIRAGEMSILGHGFVPFRGVDRWQRDHILGIVAPPRFYGRIRFLECSEVGDSKLVWEPNRFGWGYWLGAAHAITGDRAYAETFRELALDWFDKNPYPIGINYCSALEMGLRAYAWAWALALFHDSRAMDGEVLARLVQGIWTSCRHIENNLSYYFAPNTHLMGEAFALFACGAAIPEFKEASRWRKLGGEILAREALRQFHRDGTHRELSTCYHLYATDFCLQAMLIARQTAFPLPPAVEAAARNAAERLGNLVTADFTLPPVGDCDDGRLDWFTVGSLDAAPSLQAARALWPDLNLPDVPAGRNGYHVWMAEASDPRSERVASERRRAAARATVAEAASEHGHFDSGLVAYCNAGRDYALFRCGPFGYMDCGHSHDGPTSLVLHLGGQPVIVDSGTGAYTRSREIRDRFRGAASTNLLTLDGRTPSLPDDWFRWQRKTDGTLTHVHRTADRFHCAGHHDGFQAALGFAARVARSVEIVDGTALVVDRWDAANPVAPRLAWTLDPSLEVGWECCGDATEPIWRGTMQNGTGRSYYFLVCRLAADVNVTTEPSAASRDEDAARHGGAFRSKELPDIGDSRFAVASGPYSPAYGVLQETRCLVVDFPKSHSGCAVTAFSKVGPLELSMDSTGSTVVTARPPAATLAASAAGQMVQ